MIALILASVVVIQASGTSQANAEATRAERVVVLEAEIRQTYYVQGRCAWLSEPYGHAEQVPDEFRSAFERGRRAGRLSATECTAALALASDRLQSARIGLGRVPATQTQIDAITARLQSLEAGR